MCSRVTAAQLASDLSLPTRARWAARSPGRKRRRSRRVHRRAFLPLALLSSGSASRGVVMFSAGLNLLSRSTTEQGREPVGQTARAIEFIRANGDVVSAAVPVRAAHFRLNL